MDEYSVDGYARPSAGQPDFLSMENGGNILIQRRLKNLDLNYPISDQMLNCIPIARIVQGQVTDTKDEIEWKEAKNQEALQGIEIKYIDYTYGQAERVEGTKVDLRNYSNVFPEDLGGTLASDLALALDIDASKIYYDDSKHHWVVAENALFIAESDARDDYQLWLDASVDNLYIWNKYWYVGRRCSICLE